MDDRTQNFSAGRNEYFAMWHNGGHSLTIHDNEGDALFTLFNYANAWDSATGLSDDMLSLLVAAYNAGNAAGTDYGAWKAQHEMRKALGLSE